MKMKSTGFSSSHTSRECRQAKDAAKNAVGASSQTCLYKLSQLIETSGIV